MTTQPASKTVITVRTSTPPKSFLANNFDKPPVLPGVDTPKQEKAEKTTFNKFKVKILFMVPRNDKIKPCNKFAALLAVIQQQYTNTTLKQWGADDTNQAQSIISGLDLPHERENLPVFCSHV
eukprot:10675923-Ditylum_brightwellii.AAC.1